MGPSGEYKRFENIELPPAIAPTRKRLEQSLKQTAPSFDIMFSAWQSGFTTDYILHPWMLYAFVSSNISFQHADDPAAEEAFEMLKRDVTVSQNRLIFMLLQIFKSSFHCLKYLRLVT